MTLSAELAEQGCSWRPVLCASASNAKRLGFAQKRERLSMPGLANYRNIWPRNVFETLGEENCLPRWICCIFAPLRRRIHR